jgi:hypothetical protein
MSLRIDAPYVVEAAMAQVFDNMYVANTINRLRVLANPSESDCKRWIYELLQNAKDSIAGDPERKSVDIVLRVTDDSVQFDHNGAPFTANARFALIYQYTEKNPLESTGRFGTGFMTLHVLSRTPEVYGDMYATPDRTKSVGFHVKLYRDGTNKRELIQGLQRLRREEEFFEEPFGYTRFIFRLATQSNRDAMAACMKNLRANAVPTLLFCPGISSFEVFDRDRHVKYVRCPSEHVGDGIESTQFIVIENDIESRRTFLHCSLNAENDRLSQRFETQRFLRLTLAVEVNSSGNVVEQDPETPSHFCVLPLVGSEDHVMPVIINSPDFEPSTEREGLLLSGLAEQQGVITEVGINQMILEASVPLFDRLIEHCCRCQFNQLYLLAKGLRHPPDIKKYFDKAWFMQKVIIPYRDVLSRHPIVHTEDESWHYLFDRSKKPKPYCLFVTDDDEQKTLFDLHCDLFGMSRLPRKQDNYIWIRYLWEGCGIRDVTQLCQYIGERKDISHLTMQDTAQRDTIEWLDKLYAFILGLSRRQLLQDHQIIPTMTGQFVAWDDKLRDGKTLTPIMIECLCDLGQDLKPILMDNGLCHFRSQRLAHLKWPARSTTGFKTCANKAGATSSGVSEQFGQFFASFRTRCQGSLRSRRRFNTSHAVCVLGSQHQFLPFECPPRHGHVHISGFFRI